MKNKSRNEFENWFRDKIIESPDFVFNNFSDEYNNYIVGENDNIELYLHIGGHWMAWDASREALVVELPEKISKYNTNSEGIVSLGAIEYDDAIDDCKEAIESQGIKVK